MSTKTISILIIALSGFVFLQDVDGLPDLTPDRDSDSREAVVVPQDLENSLKSGFASNDKDARAWSGMLEAIARFIEADGKTSDPILKTMFDIEKLRDAVVSAPVETVSGGDVIASALSQQLSKIGKSGEPLTSERRAELVEIFLGASQVLNE